MGNLAKERKKGRNRNAVENFGRDDNGRGIAAIFLMGGAFVAGALLAAITASRRNKEKIKDVGMRKKKEASDSCKGAMNGHEDDLGLLSILPLDAKTSTKSTEQECRLGSSTKTDEKVILISQEKNLSQQFIKGHKGEAPILKRRIVKEENLHFRLQVFPPGASSLNQEDLQAVKSLDGNIEKEGDVFLPHLKAFPPCSASSLDQQNLLQAESMVGSLVSQILHDEGHSSFAFILPSQNGGIGGSDAGHENHRSLVNDISNVGGCPSDDSVSLLSLEDDGNNIGTSKSGRGCGGSVCMPSLENDGCSGGNIGDKNYYSVSLPPLENDGNAIDDDGSGCDDDNSVPLLSLQNHVNNRGGSGSRHHRQGRQSIVSQLSIKEDGNDSAGDDHDSDYGIDSSIFLPSLKDCSDIGCNSGWNSCKNDDFVSPLTLEDYDNDSGSGGGGQNGESSVFLLSLENDGNDNSGSDGQHNSEFLPLLQNDHKGDSVGEYGVGCGPVSPLLLQNDGCAGNHSGCRGGSGVDDCDGDNSLSLLLLQDDGGGAISNSDDHDMDHKKENSSVAFELENSAPRAIKIPRAAEVISCGSYSYGPESFSAGTSPITAWPQLSVSGHSKQISEANRMHFGIPFDVGDDDDEDEDQSKYIHFEQQQRSGTDARKIFEDGTKCTQELADVSWSRAALSLLQSVDTNLLVLSVGAVFLLFVVQFFIFVYMS